MKKIFTLTLWLLITTGLFAPQANAVVVPAKPVTENPDPATVKAAVDAFKNLSAKEKRAKLKEVKKAIKDFKASKKNTADPVVTNTLLLVLITILIPPLGVYLHQGEINSKFWISLILTLLFYFPGLIYSLIVILGNSGGGKS
jgi:uncharacterized membrane protein YqaE (UPF0057 family)